jgi:putative acetyltransferase
LETSADANLFAALRQQVRPIISIVAADRGAIVGHILFLPVVLPHHSEREIMGLAPMAVMPEHQRKGVGSALVRVGFATL